MWTIQRNNTKTDQESIKPKYFYIANKNETLTHGLYANKQQQKHIKFASNQNIFQLQNKTRHKLTPST